MKLIIIDITSTKTVLLAKHNLIDLKYSEIIRIKIDFYVEDVICQNNVIVSYCRNPLVGRVIDENNGLV